MKMVQKRNITIVAKFLLFLAMISMLTGCSIKDKITGAIQDELLERSNIAIEDKDYDNYVKYKDNGQINNEGYYISNDEEKTGQIKITFFNNNHLQTTYYYDEERTNVVDQNNCYLNYGESLYADLPIVINQENSKYSFSLFIVYSYLQDGQKEQFTSCDTDGKILTIPDNLNVDCLSVMAIGEYEDRQISFSSISNENGETMVLNGKWSVNGERYNGISATISSSTPYTVTYDYSSYIDDYYFYDSDPKCFNATDSTGVVEFYAEEISSNVEKFVVELKKYKELTLVNDTTGIFSNHLKSISINGQDAEFDIEKNQNIVLRTKIDDEITIMLDKGYKVKTKNLNVGKPVELNDCVEYTITVPDNEEYELSIVCQKNDASSGYEQEFIDNGNITLRYSDNKDINIGEEVDVDEKVIVEIVPNNGYYITGKDVKDNIYTKSMSYKDYLSKKEDIIDNHKILKYISLQLSTIDEYGDVNYTYDGEDVKGTIKVKEGDAISCKYVLNNLDYQFADESIVNMVVNFFKKTETKTFEIKVDSSLNGKIIKACDYVELVQRENNDDKK